VNAIMLTRVSRRDTTLRNRVLAEMPRAACRGLVELDRNDAVKDSAGASLSGADAAAGSEVP
jgi:hypothetical protein